ncbi:hypothetical protein EVAR_91828_1 [Eumeta japonica]|uniref:Reverse transcriptase RNase H-like domain-containing protein n=1 Tax=Eumeta variegata TaxID=151549 RepID=A0A4C1TJL7_EUMVA|nr:hypothetical protein EVAR_91828_1 [Eumeta japonica]
MQAQWLGGVLVQTNSEDDPRIIAYGHKTLTDCERRYCQTEKEALALVWAVEHFHIFLYDSPSRLSKDAEKSPIQLKDNHICQIVDFARLVLFLSKK